MPALGWGYQLVHEALNLSGPQPDRCCPEWCPGSWSSAATSYLLFQRHGQVYGGLPTELHHQTVRQLFLDDIHDVFQGHRLEEELVRGIVISGNRLWIVIDDVGLYACSRRAITA